jgi:hypothetical protein
MEKDMIQMEKDTIKDINFGTDLSGRLSFEVAYSALRAAVKKNCRVVSEVYPRMDELIFFKIVELVAREVLLENEYTNY